MTPPTAGLPPLPLLALSIAKGYLGENRAQNHDQIAKFLALFGLPFAQNGVPVSFCAAGVSWCLCKAYAQIHGVPFTTENAVEVFHNLLGRIQGEIPCLSPSCHVMITDAKQRGAWREGVAGALPGDRVFFCWNGSGIAEHVGFVEFVEGDAVHTVEFNTSDSSNANGGAVARKTRNAGVVVGYIV